MSTEIVDRFSLSFEGPAVAGHQIEASEFIKTVSALNELAVKSVEASGGNASLKISGEIRAGSVIVDFILTHQALIEATGCAFSGLNALIDLINLVKFLKGYEPKRICNNDGKIITVFNNEGESQNFNNCTVNFYQSQKGQSNLCDLTSALDDPGIDKIKILSENEEIEGITKTERPYFKNIQVDAQTEIIKRSTQVFYVIKVSVISQNRMKVTVVSEDGSLRGTLLAPRIPENDLFASEEDCGLSREEIDVILEALRDHKSILLNVKMEIASNGRLSGGEILRVENV